MTAHELIERWSLRQAEWSKLHVQVDGAALAGEVIADLERVMSGELGESVTYTKAAKLSGYSVDHIGRLVRGGKLRNVGRKGAPRVLADELPRRPSLNLADTPKASYDPVSDARSLRRSAVRSNHGS